MSDVLARIRLIDAAALTGRVSMRAAIDAVRTTLETGFDPEEDLPRSILDVPHGQLLLMPAVLQGAVGQKLATVAPGNPERGLERIQAVYVLFDDETLAPRALLDGTALTSLRTPAVSAACVDRLAGDSAGDVVVFGSGPQGIGHVAALAQIRTLRTVRFIGRDRGRAEAAVAASAAALPAVDIRVGGTEDIPGADLIVCATTAAEPLFPAEAVSDRATVVAVGSHEPDHAELDPALLGRGQVIVESRRVALAEAGDVIRALRAGALREDELVTMHALFTGITPAATDRPRIVKTCGMGWQDLAVARLAL